MEEKTREHTNQRHCFRKDVTLQSGGRWPLARVIRVYPGTDKLVRAVDLQCGTKVYKRGVDRLIKLYIEDGKEENSDAAPQSISDHTTASPATSVNSSAIGSSVGSLTSSTTSDGSTVIASTTTAL